LLLAPAILLYCEGDSRRESAPQKEQASQTSQVSADAPRVTDRVIIRVAGKPVRVRISQTPDELQRGLMSTEDLPADEGMLFVFQRQEILHFWMKDTPLPLSVAFIDKNRRILEICRMEPLDEKTIYTSEQPAIYALEMNAGWFQAHGVKVGDMVEF
jgi:uncharacterized membrane protein (UPF0127 family)